MGLKEHITSLNPSSISQILSPDFSFLNEATDRQSPQNKRRRTENWPELESAVFEWIRRAEVILLYLRLYGRKQGSFDQLFIQRRKCLLFSNGWLHGFQSRWKVKDNIQHGEARSLSQEASTEMLRIRQVLITPKISITIMKRAYTGDWSLTGVYQHTLSLDGKKKKHGLASYFVAIQMPLSAFLSGSLGQQKDQKLSWHLESI